MDYVRSKAAAALGARLRRLSEAVDGDTARIYAELGVVFEQRWFGVLNQLRLGGPATVGDIAGRLRITHASVSQSRHSLQAAGLVTSEADHTDRRRHLIFLTDKGHSLATRLGPVWQAFEAAAEEVDAEAGNVVAALDRLDAALAERSLFDRIRAKLPA